MDKTDCVDKLITFAIDMKGIITYIRVKLMPKHVSIDGNDGTITVSRWLYRAMLLLGLEKGNRIYVFRVKGSFGFAVNPKQLEGVDTNFYELQYNSKTKTVGFCPTCPSVALMLYELGFPHDSIVRRRVTTHYNRGLVYFTIVS